MQDAGDFYPDVILKENSVGNRFRKSKTTFLILQIYNTTTNPQLQMTKQFVCV